ncbi:MAG: hypothetical protein Q9194_003013 [Teloschistes cf. exilis]
MSGAEALAAAGLASNILHFIDFTTQLCLRIQEYSSAASGLPKALAQQAAHLSHLLSLFKELQEQSGDQQDQDAILESCRAQALELADIFESFRTDSSQSRWKHAKAAFKSMRRTEQIDKLQSTLDQLVRTLSLQLQIEAKRAADRTGTDVSKILSLQSGQLGLLQQIQKVSSVEETEARSQVAPTPRWIVPLSRNSRFVGREDILEDLEELLSQRRDGSIVAVLYGLGGVGKTQVALEYIYRTRSPLISVFWVHGSSLSRFMESYKRIAIECDIPGHNDPDNDTMQLVRDWLEISCVTQWLMIVDNVDDRTVFFEQDPDMATGRALVEYIPQAANGTVIYTTRSRDIGVDLLSGSEPIKVSPLSIEEGIFMLGDRLTRNVPRDTQEILLEELAYLPLAISQAAAFMVKRRKSVTEYIRLLQDESTKSRVLGHRTLHHGREDRSSESVTSTWWITFQHLEQENARSVELLMMMSLIDRQQIPLGIFQDPSEVMFDFEDAVGLLEAFSLISTYSYAEVCDHKAMDMLYNHRHGLKELSHTFCDMHRLVQRSTKDWLGTAGDFGLYTAIKTLRSCADVFPSGFFETWPLCRILYPHANAILRYQYDKTYKTMKDDDSIASYRSSLLHKLSTYSRQLGNLQESEQRASQAMDLRKTVPTVPGTESREFLESMESYALTISMLGRREEACLMQQRVFEGFFTLLGPNHRRTLEARNQLGHSLRALGEYAAAEAQHREELSAKRLLLDQDPSDPDLIDDLVIAINNVANVMRDQGEYEEAYTLLQEALVRSSGGPFGEEHPLYWLTKESLAIVSGVMEKRDQAHELFAEVLAWRIKAYGEQHHSTLITRGQYMSLLSQEGDYAAAEEEGTMLLKDEVLTLGSESHATLHNHGNTLQQRKKYREAELVYKRLLQLQQESPGTWTGSSARLSNARRETSLESTRELIRITLEAQGKMEEAKGYAAISLSSPTDNDPPDARKLHEKSLDLFREGDFAGAEAVARHELELRTTSSGLDDDRTQTCLFQIARAIHEQDPFNDSQTLARQVLAYRKRVHGWRSNGTHDILAFLAATVRDQEKLEEAEKLYRQLVLWVDNSFGKLDVKTYEARWGLANVLSRQQRYPESEELYRQNLQAQLDNPTESLPEHTAQAYFNLGCVLRYQKKNQEGEACFREAYDRRVKLFGEADGRSTKVLLCLAEIAEEQGKSEEAGELYASLCKVIELPQSDDEEEQEGTEDFEPTSDGDDGS